MFVSYGANRSRSSASVLPVGRWVHAVQPLIEEPSIFLSAVEGALNWPAVVLSPPALFTVAVKVRPLRT